MLKHKSCKDKRWKTMLLSKCAVYDSNVGSMSIKSRFVKKQEVESLLSIIGKVAILGKI